MKWITFHQEYSISKTFNTRKINVCENELTKKGLSKTHLEIELS